MTTTLQPISPWNTQTQSSTRAKFPSLTSKMHEGHRLERPIGARCIQNHPTGGSSTCQHQWAEAGGRGRRGQPRLRRGASLHFSTNTQSRKWSSPAAGGNQLVSDVIPHSSHLVGWLQSHGRAVRINKHEGGDWLEGWGGKGRGNRCDWGKRRYICQEFLKHKLQNWIQFSLFWNVNQQHSNIIPPNMQGACKRLRMG